MKGNACGKMKQMTNLYKKSQKIIVILNGRIRNVMSVFNFNYNQNH